MEDSSSLTFSDETWADDFARAIVEQRAGVEQFVSSQRERLEKARASLTEQAQQIAEELGQERAEAAQARQRLEHRSEEINQQAEQIQRQQAELAERREEQERRRVEIDEAQAKLHHDRQAFTLERQEHQAEVDHLADARGRLEGETVELANQREQLVADQARTEKQRRHIAKELKAKREAQFKEIERRRADLSSLDSGQSGEALRQLDDLAQERKEFDKEKESFQAERDQLAQQRDEMEGRRAEIDESQAALARDRQAFALAHEEHQADVEHVASLRAQAEERIAELAEQREAVATDRARTEGQRRRIAQEFKAQRAATRKEIQRHREALEDAQTTEEGQLRKQLLETESRLAEAEQRAAESMGDSGGSAADEDLQRRYEMALDDLRDLKARNADLEEQAAQAAAAGAQTATSGDVLDWETEKRRMLASLESDFDEDVESDAAERLKIEEVVRRTDKIAASKDGEIDELRRQLAAQDSQFETVTDGAAAVREVLDQDVIIAEEREKLRGLQAEWDDKLRQAEIDLSIERAQMARQHSEFEEKVRIFEESQGQAGPGEESSKPGAAPRGRWLSMLGLGDAKEK